jgi:hypothetical protein
MRISRCEQKVTKRQKARLPLKSKSRNSDLPLKNHKTHKSTPASKNQKGETAFYL